MNPNQKPFGSIKLHYVCCCLKLDKGRIVNLVERLACDLAMVTCSPCVRPPCTYRWIDRVSNLTVALGRQLSLTEHIGSSYSFQCQITCLAQGRMISINADVITCVGAIGKIPWFKWSLVIPMIRFFPQWLTLSWHQRVHAYDFMVLINQLD